MKQKGFSLIEMMVVISIIILLTSIGFSLLSKESAKARDNVRVADFHQLKKALDQYYIKYNMYPCGDSGDDDPNKSDLHDCKSGDGPDGIRFLDGRVSPRIPAAGCTALGGVSYGLVTEGLLDHSIIDPLDKQPYEYGYQISNDRQKYTLGVILEEDENDFMKNDGGMCDNYYEVGNLGDFSDTANDFLIRWCTGNPESNPTHTPCDLTSPI